MLNEKEGIHAIQMLYSISDAENTIITKEEAKKKWDDLCEIDRKSIEKSFNYFFG